MVKEENSALKETSPIEEDFLSPSPLALDPFYQNGCPAEKIHEVDCANKVLGLICPDKKDQTESCEKCNKKEEFVLVFLSDVLKHCYQKIKETNYKPGIYHILKNWIFEPVVNQRRRIKPEHPLWIRPEVVIQRAVESVNLLSREDEKVTKEDMTPVVMELLQECKIQ